MHQQQQRDGGRAVLKSSSLPCHRLHSTPALPSQRVAIFTPPPTRSSPHNNTRYVYLPHPSTALHFSVHHPPAHSLAPSLTNRIHARRPRDPVIAPVISVGPSGEEVTDLNSHLLRNRIIFVGQRINDQVAVQVVASLLALNSIDDQKEIKMYINCAAGSSYAVTSILDTMKMIGAPISTVAFGMVGGSAVHLLAAGDKGKRFSMPNTRIMLQQPNGGAMGSADEVNIQAIELNRTMKMMYQYVFILYVVLFACAAH